MANANPHKNRIEHNFKSCEAVSVSAMSQCKGQKIISNRKTRSLLLSFDTPLAPSAATMGPTMKNEQPGSFVKGSNRTKAARSRKVEEFQISESGVRMPKRERPSTGGDCVLIDRYTSCPLSVRKILIKTSLIQGHHLSSNPQVSSPSTGHAKLEAYGIAHARSCFIPIFHLRVHNRPMIIAGALCLYAGWRLVLSVCERMEN